MDSSYVNSLVCLKIELDNGSCRYGTGLHIRDGMIISSRHVVSHFVNIQNPCFHKEKEIWIWWRNHGVDQKFIPYKFPDKCQILWENESLDAILIKVEDQTFPPDFLKFRYNGKIRDGERWQSKGFTRCGTKNDKRNLKGFNGTTIEEVSDEVRSEYNVATWPSEIQSWRGASGMPILVEDTVIGIAQSIPNGFDGNRIVATPISRIFDCETFKSYIFPKTELPNLIKEITLCYIDDETMVSTLSEVFELDRTSSDLGKDISEKISAGQPHEILIKLVNKIGKLNKPGEDPNTGSKLTDFTLRVLTEIFLDGTSFSEIASTSKTSSRLKDIGEASVNTKFSAELISAKIQSNPKKTFIPEFLKKKNRHELPIGKYHFPVEPVLSSDGSIGASIVEEIVSRNPDMRNLRVRVKEGNFPHIISENLAELFGHDDMDKKNAFEFSNEILKDMEDRNERKYYLTINLNKFGRNQQAILEQLYGLQERIPELLIIPLRNELKPEEKRMAISFGSLIPVHTENSNE